MIQEGANWDWKLAVRIVLWKTCAQKRLTWELHAERERELSSNCFDQYTRMHVCALSFVLLPA